MYHTFTLFRLLIIIFSDFRHEISRGVLEIIHNDNSLQLMRRYVVDMGCRHRQLTEAEVRTNHEWSQTRAKVEHVFMVVKHLWRYTKVKI